MNFVQLCFASVWHFVIPTRQKPPQRLQAKRLSTRPSVSTVAQMRGTREISCWGRDSIHGNVISLSSKCGRRQSPATWRTFVDLAGHQEGRIRVRDPFAHRMYVMSHNMLFYLHLITCGPEPETYVDTRVWPSCYCYMYILYNMYTQYTSCLYSCASLNL